MLDVAHNPHSVAALAANLDAMGFFQNTYAVFGAMADKDLAPMFDKIAPIIDHWYFTDLPTARAASALMLAERWKPHDPKARVKVKCFQNPKDALQEAANNAQPADRIVVFGSFYTVGGVLTNGVARLPTPQTVA